MQKPLHHIFVCTSSRANGQQKGFCHTKTSVDVMMKFMEEIEARELGGEVFISNTGCFGICEKGPDRRRVSGQCLVWLGDARGRDGDPGPAHRRR